MSIKTREELLAYQRKATALYRERHPDKILKYRQEHRMEFVERSRKYNHDLRFKVLSHYGPNGKLGCCWEGCSWTNSEALSINHIRGGGVAHRKEIGGGGTVFYRWLVKNKYPEGYQTLCMNHQFVKRHTNNELGGNQNKGIQ